MTIKQQPRRQAHSFAGGAEQLHFYFPRVIAHVEANTFKEVFDITWPENSSIGYKKKPKAEIGDDLWAEAYPANSRSG